MAVKIETGTLVRPGERLVLAGAEHPADVTRCTAFHVPERIRCDKVIGKPDPVAMEVVKAFVSLKTGWTPTPELRRELLAHARVRLGAAIAPREIDFAPSLPKTRSGKIMRRLLKGRELGLPEGDISAQEEASRE